MTPCQTSNASIGMLASIVANVWDFFLFFTTKFSYVTGAGRQLTDSNRFWFLFFTNKFLHIKQIYHGRRQTEGCKKHKNSRIQIASGGDDGATGRKTPVLAFGRRDETI
jgi:hypothetical protein